MKLAQLALAIPALLAGCATGPTAEDHAAHHPPGAAARPSAASSMAHMDSMMKSMQDLHDKMKATKAPDERAALMKDHMKLMHDGMAMMGRMRGGMGGGTPMSPEMMSKRMDMMEMMMQMMMDREALKPAAGP